LYTSSTDHEMSTALLFRIKRTHINDEHLYQPTS
jgi:hypothetical protein